MRNGFANCLPVQHDFLSGVYGLNASLHSAQRYALTCVHVIDQAQTVRPVHGGGIRGQSVHIVDDDEAVRELVGGPGGVRGVFGQEHRSAIEFLNSPGGLAADCFVVDIRMPEMDGVQLQQELNPRGVTTPLIIITGHADVRLAVQAMKAGACDFRKSRLRVSGCSPASKRL